MTADALPFTPDPTNSSCQLYTTRAGDSLTRLSAQGRIGVARILQDNWGGNALPVSGTLKPGLKIRLCNMPVVPSGEAYLITLSWQVRAAELNGLAAVVLHPGCLLYAPLPRGFQASTTPHLLQLSMWGASKPLHAAPTVALNRS
jgi:hypothetical protein